MMRELKSKIGKNEKKKQKGKFWQNNEEVILHDDIFDGKKLDHILAVLSKGNGFRILFQF